MPYTTSIERIAQAEGREEGRLEAKREDVRAFVRARFGAVLPALEERLAAADEATLNALIQRAATVPTPDQL
jgi:hypothetical protein